MNKKYTLGPDIDLDTEVVVDERGRRITEARAEQIAEETLQEIARDAQHSLEVHSTHRRSAFGCDRQSRRKLKRKQNASEPLCPNSRASYLKIASRPKFKPPIRRLPYSPTRDLAFQKRPFVPLRDRLVQ